MSDNEKWSKNSSLSKITEEYRAKIRRTYDSNDSYVRGIDAFSKYLSLNKVVKTVKEDGKTVCYVSVNKVAVDAYSEYFAHMLQYFCSHKLTQEEVARYIIDVAKKELSTETSIIKLEVADGKVVNDKGVADLIKESYETSVNEVVGILRGNIITQ